MEDIIYLMTESALQNFMTRKEDFKRNPDLFLKASEPLSYSFNGYNAINPKVDYYYLKIQSDGTAVANIFGSLEKNPDPWEERYFGIINLTKLLADVEKAKTDDKVKKMVFVYDCPGGTVAGTPEVAKAIYDFGKPNYGYITGQCCSGALWLAVNHNNIYASNGVANYVGSVGVVTMHVDKSKFYEEEMGYKITLVTNKKSTRKTDGNQFEPLSEQARTEIVRKADEIYAAFLTTIKKNYPDVPEEFLDGRVFSANDAKTFGIVKNIIDSKKLFSMDENEGLNPNTTATASNLSTTAQNGGAAAPVANDAVLVLLTEIKSSLGSLESKIEAKVEQKLATFEERFQAIEARIGVKPKNSSKVIAMVEDEEGNFKTEPTKKTEYKAANTLPAIIDDRQNVLKHFKSVEEHNKFLATAEKYLSREAFTPEFFSMAFDATRFNNEVGQFFEVVAYTYKENLLKFETLKYLKMFDGVVDKIYLASSYKKKFLSLHSEARRDVVVVETSPNSISVKILSGRTKQDMLTLQQTALSYIDKPKNTDPYNVMSYWQWQIIYQSVLDAIMDDMGEAVWIGQENTYAVVPDEANPLNAFDGLLTIICKNLALPTPDIGLHVTGALTVANTYEKLRDMLRAIPKDVMTEAKKSGKGVIYMNQNTYNKFLDSVKDAFATNIYNTVFEHKAVYGYLFLPIVENDFLPDDAILIDPTNVLAYATHTGADQTNIKVEAHLFDIYLHGHLKLGAGIVNYYWNNPDDLKYRLHVNDMLPTGYTLRPQLP